MNKHVHELTCPFQCPTQVKPVTDNKYMSALHKHTNSFSKLTTFQSTTESFIFIIGFRPVCKPTCGVFQDSLTYIPLSHSRPMSRPTCGEWGVTLNCLRTPSPSSLNVGSEQLRTRPWILPSPSPTCPLAMEPGCALVRDCEIYFNKLENTLTYTFIIISCYNAENEITVTK